MAKASPLGVFINCPFDSEYQKFFDAIVFAVIRCGFVARCAREVDDGSGTRIDKIMTLIEECPFGIHDISRTELDPTSRLPRFNMPLELGIFFGAKRYGSRQQKKKQCLILDREKFRYQKFISDIAGQDIHAHEQTVRKIIVHVRDFLQPVSGKRLPGGGRIATDFGNFERAKTKLCKDRDLKWKELTFGDHTHVIAEWISEQRGVTV
jgi:hypothetical protein